MSKPDLSVAIIFKNEIRCLERCLRSLQPLRERLSLQTVMADTGSTDGSRTVAEQYADVLIDFPWIDDFAAARNAVLDRCKGRWVLVIDCDEWLDENLDEMTQFLKSGGARTQDAALMTIRNYSTTAFDQYNDFNAIRLVNMASAPRYVGAIHEQIAFENSINCRALTRTFLHHDGYVMLNDGSEAGKAKVERNLKLLRAQKERDPNNLRTISMYLDSAVKEPDYLDTLRHALKLVENKTGEYKHFGAPLFRTAIEYAYTEKLPELEQWGEMASSQFPNSYFTKIDTYYLLLLYAHDRKNYREVVRFGESYMQACNALEDDINGWAELRFGVLQRRGERWAAIVAGCIAEAYYYLGEYDHVISTLKAMPWEGLDDTGVRGILTILRQLCKKTELDTDGVMTAFWHGILAEQPSKEAMEQRRTEFLNVGKRCFLNSEEAGNAGSVCALFLPLRGECILGDYAALMAAETQEEADALLKCFEDLTELPAVAFIHALRIGAEFPMPGKGIPVELADVMANKLSTDAAFLREAVLFSADAFESAADLNWVRALALAALQGNDWGTDADPLPLLRAFVRIESTFLARCYTVQALQHPGYLPPLHRFGLHFVNAFAVLSPVAISPEFTPTVAGGVRGALAELKEAVIASPGQKAVVDVVLNNISNS